MVDKDDPENGMLESIDSNGDDIFEKMQNGKEIEIECTNRKKEP